MQLFRKLSLRQMPTSLQITTLIPPNLIFPNSYPVSGKQVVMGAWLPQNASWKGQSGTESVVELSTRSLHIQVLLKAERQLAL